MREPTCPDCEFFDYDEIWDGEEEIELYHCDKENYDHIGYGMPPCEMFKMKGEV